MRIGGGEWEHMLPITLFGVSIFQERLQMPSQEWGQLPDQTGLAACYRQLFEKLASDAATSLEDLLGHNACLVIRRLVR